MAARQAASSSGASESAADAAGHPDEVTLVQDREAARPVGDVERRVPVAVDYELGHEVADAPVLDLAQLEGAL
jgi:hypothetical protein